MKSSIEVHMPTPPSTQEFPGPTSGPFSDVYPRGKVASVEASDGSAIHYEVHGEGGLSFVFIHGGMCDRTYWALQVEELSRLHSVITLDLPGHGESDKTRQQWSIGAFGSDVVRVIRAASVDKAIIVGHSLGGLVAVEAARLLGDIVVGVVVVDILHQPHQASPAPPPMPADDQSYRTALANGLRRGMFTARSDAARTSRIIDAMVAFPRGLVASLRAAFDVYDGPAALEAIESLPLLMIQSELRPTDADDIRRSHPTARIAILGGTGHFLMIESPQEFNALMVLESARARRVVRFV